MQMPFPALVKRKLEMAPILTCYSCVSTGLQFEFQLQLQVKIYNWSHDQLLQKGL